MIKTIPADNIGIRNLGYTLLAIPSDSTKRQMVDLLDKLKAEFPDVFWSMPIEQLHITLCEIIQPKDYSQDKEALFNLHKDDYENTPTKILSTMPKFTITFNMIEASPQAIIVKSNDSSIFNTIRSKLTASMKLPTGTRTPPDITHSSIARYLQEVDLERVQEVIARHRISIDEEITNFKLVRTKVLPLQKYEVLKNYPLATS